ALIGKLIILLIPILGVLYPMVRFLPRLYDWRMRSKVLRMYGELRFLEDELRSARGTGHSTTEMVARLGRLEEQANHLGRSATTARDRHPRADLFESGAQPRLARRRVPLGRGLAPDQAVQVSRPAGHPLPVPGRDHPPPQCLCGRLPRPCSRRSP